MRCLYIHNQQTKWEIARGKSIQNIKTQLLNKWWIKKNMEYEKYEKMEANELKVINFFKFILNGAHSKRNHEK